MESELMPMHPVTVRRWEVAVAFVAVTVAFVLGLVKVTEAQHHTDRVARRADVALLKACREHQRRDALIAQAQRGALQSILGDLVVRGSLSKDEASSVMERFTVAIGQATASVCKPSR